MFGKKMSEYASLQGPLLAALVVVGLARLALSLAGLPDATVKWVAPNIYAAPEFSPPAPLSPWVHIAAHLTVGMLAVSLIGWGVMSLAMQVGRKLSPARA